MTKLFISSLPTQRIVALARSAEPRLSYETLMRVRLRLHLPITNGIHYAIVSQAIAGRVLLRNYP